MTRLISPPQCAGHDPGPGHPENPGRLRAVLDALAEAYPRLEPVECRPASRDQLKLAHDDGFVERVLAAIPDQGRRALDPDTVVGPGSDHAALAAAGAVIEAIDAVMAGQARNAFCAVRPPGHHAERARAMGFCLFNQVAIGACHALELGCGRVAIVDFDVHHGNGTQQIFESDPRVMYASSHQWPLYPGTGGADETGAGNILNVPLAPGAGSAEFRAAYTDAIVPALEAFGPDFLLVSAGFDAHRLDPLAGLNLVESDFGWVTGELARLAKSRCRGRLVSVLEGGYHAQALGASAVAHVGALLQA